MRPTHRLPEQSEGKTKVIRQQYLPFTVCAEGCETAEEQSDDEVRTSQVPERREGKTKVIKQQYLPFTVLKQWHLWPVLQSFSVATIPTVCGIETLMICVKEEWQPVVATTPTACGIETISRSILHIS